jgi:hypothetical protein
MYMNKKGRVAYTLQDLWSEAKAQNTPNTNQISVNGFEGRKLPPRIPWQSRTIIGT